MRTFVLLILLMTSVTVSLHADTSPEEQSALIPLSSPAVRYWNPAMSDGLAVQTVSIGQNASRVPLRQQPKLLVLLYHNVVFGRTGNVYNRDLYNFEHDLAYIKRNLTVTNFGELLERKTPPVTDQAIITFDDGDLSLYAIVYPLFKQYDIEATIFLVPNFIGQVGYMSWDQVREMSGYRNKEGKKLFHFGSHSLTHRRLGDLSREEIFNELKVSKEIIESETGEPVSVLALPFGNGAGDRRIEEAAENLGYQAIRTSFPSATPLSDIDRWEIGALNIENYSTDVMVQKSLTLLGRR